MNSSAELPYSLFAEAISTLLLPRNYLRVVLLGSRRTLGANAGRYVTDIKPRTDYSLQMTKTADAFHLPSNAPVAEL